MTDLTNNQFNQYLSKINITSTSAKPKKKTNNYQEISLLKKLLKSEIREAKGQYLVNTYIKLLERQYETLIENSINNNELLKAHKNNRIFQRVLDKTKSKNSKKKSRSKSKKDSSTNNNNTKTFSVYNNKISTSKSTLNISPIKKKNKNEEENNVQLSTFWKDYDFLRVPHQNQTRNNKKIKNKNSNEKNSLKRKNTKVTNTSTISKNIFLTNNQLENYYLYLLNRRHKISENEETNEEKKKEKLEVEILRQILEKLYEDDEKLKKYLDDENIPEFYKRFIIQNEIKKDNLFANEFKLNYKESQSLKGPKLCPRSELICKYLLNYEPIYKRLDKIIKNQKKNLEKIKENVEKNKNNNINNTQKRVNLNETKQWLESMDNWYQKKINKIKDKKEELEKKDPNVKECKFKPFINNNARIKREDEGLLCSDRLYLEYFTLRDKKKKMIEEEKKHFSFHPDITHKKYNIKEDDFC